jgi:hypothetical protein
MLLGSVFVALGFLAWRMWASTRDESSGVLLTGVHHMGKDFNIASFYIDGYSGGNVGRGGGGASDVCCVELPRKWRPGMTVDVRWQAVLWQSGPEEDSDPISYQLFRARVPVEHYATPEHLYVHFFSGGKVRVVSSEFYPESINHPVPRSPNSSEQATQGASVQKLFDESELAVTDNRDERRGWK